MTNTTQCSKNSAAGIYRYKSNLSLCDMIYIWYIYVIGYICDIYYVTWYIYDIYIYDIELQGSTIELLEIQTAGVGVTDCGEESWSGDGWFARCLVRYRGDLEGRDSSLLCLRVACPVYLAFPGNRSARDRATTGLQGWQGLLWALPTPEVCSVVFTCWLALCHGGPHQGALGRRSRLTVTHNEGGSPGHGPA